LRGGRGVEWKKDLRGGFKVSKFASCEKRWNDKLNSLRECLNTQSTGIYKKIRKSLKSFLSVVRDE
jgi:hypothetical protein